MSQGIEIAIINGSVRPNNYTSMATALVADELVKKHQVAVKIIRPERKEARDEGPRLIPMDEAKPSDSAFSIT